LNTCNKIRGLLHKAEASDIKGRYRIAKHCFEVRSNGDYGDSAVEKLADFVGWDPATVHEYAGVCAAWSTEQEFLSFVGQPGENDKPLGFSFYIQLAKEPKKGERRKLHQRARKHGMTLAQLKSERRNGGSQSDAKESDKPTAPLQIATQAVLSKVDELKDKFERWNTEIPKRISDAKLGVVSSALTDMQRARKELEEQFDVIDSWIDHLKKQKRLQARRQSKEAKVAKPKRRAAA